MTEELQFGQLTSIRSVNFNSVSYILYEELKYGSFIFLMATIFISYRRVDTGDIAKAICHRLEKLYGSNAIFLDDKKIRSGQDLRLRIKDALYQSKIFLPLIDKGWISSLEDSKIDEGTWASPNDWVKLEAKEAFSLRSQGLSVIPVLINLTKSDWHRLHQIMRQYFEDDDFYRLGIEFQEDRLYVCMSNLIQAVNENLEESLLKFPPKSGGGLSLYEHETKYCVQNSKGKKISKMGNVYLKSLRQYYSLADGLSDLLKSAQRNYDAYSNFVKQIVLTGHIEKNQDGKRHLSREARRYLRRLEDILAIPEWHTLTIEAEPKQIQHIINYDLATMELEALESSRRELDIYRNFIKGSICNKHIEKKDDGEVYLSEEARKHLRRLEAILEIPERATITKEDEPKLIAKIIAESSY